MKRFCLISCLVCLSFLSTVYSAPWAQADEAPAAQKAKYEMLYWESVKDSKNIEMLRAYINKYPNGNFVDLANIKIKALEKNTPEAPAATPNPPEHTVHSATVSEVHLRSIPEKLEEKELQKMLQKFNFCDLKRNQNGDFKNAFKDNENGTITDEATGLTWEKVGSWRKQSRARAEGYIAELNRQKFAGRSNWRLPTLEELASLLESHYSSRDWLYIDPIFGDPGGDWIDICWSADTLQPFWGAEEASWVVSFKNGSIVPAIWVKGTLSGFSPQHEHNYVRAVSTTKQ